MLDLLTVITTGCYVVRRSYVADENISRRFDDSLLLVELLT